MGHEVDCHTWMLCRPTFSLSTSPLSFHRDHCCVSKGKGPWCERASKNRGLVQCEGGEIQNQQKDPHLRMKNLRPPSWAIAWQSFVGGSLHSWNCC
eukprot:2917332-Amphidinium_carterae.1